MSEKDFIQQLTLQYLVSNSKYKDLSPDIYYDEYKKIFEYFSERIEKDKPPVEYTLSF